MSGNVYHDSAELQASAARHKQAFLEQMFGYDALAAGAPEPLQSISPESGIVGVGFGTKHTAGSGVQGEIAVRVYVRSKRPKSELSAAEIVPADINGTATDVIQIGDVFASTSCGDSIGHVAVTAGTLGCVVEIPGTPDRYVLSNNHVLANSNAATIGDPILAPGPMDGGKLPRIASLTAFKLIDFVLPNDLDAAIAKIDDPATVVTTIPSVGTIASPASAAALYQSVRKQGRTTRHTVGVITDLSASIRVRYGTKVALFNDQLGITGLNGAFSAGGDSGSLIVDAVRLQPVGLLFAGGTGITFANPISKVLAHFGISIVP